MSPALALALAALAASSAAAKELTEHFFTITLTEGRVGATQAYVGRNDGRVQQIQASGGQWGEAGKVESFTVKQGVKPVASTGGVTVAAGDVDGDDSVGASEKVTVDGGRTEARKLPPELPVMASNVETTSAQATGKRQHTPLRFRTYYDSPLPSGSLRVKVKMPWMACKVGARYPAITLSDGASSQELQDVTVASCGGGAGTSEGPGDEGPEESITFVYGKVGVKSGKVLVRGWDAERKEE